MASLWPSALIANHKMCRSIIALPERVKHVCGGVSMQESVNCSLWRGCGGVWGGVFQNQSRRRQSNWAETSVKSWGGVSFFFSPCLVCWLPPLQLYVRLICQRRFELQAPWASPPRIIKVTPGLLSCGTHVRASVPPLPPALSTPHPTLYLFWLNLLAEGCLITPARTYPPRPNDSLILIPHLPSALTSARGRSLQGHVHIYKREMLFIFFFFFITIFL